MKDIYAYAKPEDIEEQQQKREYLKQLQTTPYSNGFNAVEQALKLGDRVKDFTQKRAKTDTKVDIDQTTGDIIIEVRYKNKVLYREKVTDENGNPKRDKNGKEKFQTIRETRDRKDIVTIESDEEKPGEALAALAKMQKSSSRKLLTYTLQKINSELLDNGVFKGLSNTIEISYKQLVYLGIYKNARTAKRGYCNFYEILRRCNIKVWESTEGGEYKQLLDQNIVYNLDTTRVDAAMVSVNEKLQWNQLKLKYFYLPLYYYQLPDNAADLLYYICTLAPQKWKEIEEKGQFILSYEAIRAYLQLPDPDKATNLTTQIKSPIEKAIGELADQTGRDKELQIIPDNKPARRIQDYLNLQLIVKVGGDYKTQIIKYNKEKSKRAERLKRIKENEKAKIAARAELKNAENKADT